MRAIEGIDELSLGCAIEFGFFRELEGRLAVPVIDATITSFKYAEFLDLKKRLGWDCNRMGECELTYEGEIKKWKLW